MIYFRKAPFDLIFLNENEDLRKDLTEEGKEMAGFLTLLVETAMKPLIDEESIIRTEDCSFPWD